jgi:membrane-bound serine protease (ClpP class)
VDDPGAPDYDPGAPGSSTMWRGLAVAHPILLLEIALVAAGVIFLIIEFKLPGHFISGIIAVVCFSVYFWLHFQHGGPIILLGITLFAIGLVLVAFEVFMLPGHGIAGVCGILLMLAGLVLGGLDTWPDTPSDWADAAGLLLRHVLTLAGGVAAAFVLANHLPDIPGARWLVLVPPEDKFEQDDPYETSAHGPLLGQVGITTSLLRPSGIAHFDNRRIDVTSEWELIEPGTPVQIVEMEGSRIVVKRHGAGGVSLPSRSTSVH